MSWSQAIENKIEKGRRQMRGRCSHAGVTKGLNLYFGAARRDQQGSAQDRIRVRQSTCRRSLTPRSHR